jgi:hypothetical protein
MVHSRRSSSCTLFFPRISPQHSNLTDLTTKEQPTTQLDMHYATTQPATQPPNVMPVHDPAHQMSRSLAITPTWHRSLPACRPLVMLTRSPSFSKATQHHMRVVAFSREGWRAPKCHPIGSHIPVLAVCVHSGRLCATQLMSLMCNRCAVLLPHRDERNATEQAEASR